MTDLPTLREMLATQRARLKIAIGNEAKSARVSPQAGRIMREVERLTALISEREAEAEAVEAAVPPPLAPNAGAAGLVAGGWSLAVIGRACKVSRETAKRWRKGIKTPDAGNRRVLAKPPFGISTGAWERKVGEPEPERQPRRKPLMHQGTTEALRGQVAEYEAILDDPNLTVDARLKAQRGRTSALVALQRSEGAHLTEAAALKLPSVRRILERLAVLRAEAIRMGWSVPELVRAEAAEFERMTET